jgi:hypothetical protein
MRKTKKPATLAPEPPIPNVSDFQEKLSHLLREEAKRTMIALRQEDEREEADKALAEAKTQMKRARDNLFAELLEKTPDLVDLLAPQHNPTCERSVRYPEWKGDCFRCALLLRDIYNIQIQLKFEEL